MNKRNSIKELKELLALIPENQNVARYNVETKIFELENNGKLDKEIKALLKEHEKSHHECCELAAVGQCTCGFYIAEDIKTLGKKHGAHIAYIREKYLS